MVLGCKDDQWCLLATPQIGTTMPLSTVTRYSIGDLPAVGDLTYGYGCSQFFERAVKQGWKVVNIKFFCQGTLGALIMRQSLTGLLVGGNVCVNNPAMPGYSGSAILTYSSDPSTGIFDRLNLIGTLNSGYPGLFSCIWSLPKTLLKDAQAAFQNLQRGFNGQKPEPPDATVALPAQARFANWGDIPSEQKALWAEIWNANPYMVAVKGSTTHFAFYLNNDSEKFLGTLIVVENDALRQARKEGLFKPGLVQQLDVTLVSAQAISKEES